MYLIKLREFIDARMLDVGTGEGMGGIQNRKLHRLRIFITECFLGQCKRVINVFSCRC